MNSNATRRAAVAAGCMLLSTIIPINAIAQTATDLVCKGCVSSRDVKNESITSRDIKNGSVFGRDIRDGSIKTEDLSSTVFPASGAAASDFIDDFTTSTFESIVSTSITAPTAGLLLVFGSVSAEDDLSIAGGGTLLGRISIDGVATTNEEFFAEMSTSNADNILGAVMALNIVVPVDPGVHTVAIEAREAGSGSFILGRSISVLFVANGSGVSVPFASKQAGLAANALYTKPQRRPLN
ncbi:MAG TPA: hypothetical protein VMP03_00730 [Methylomirabilota bacterium]|nr:hypothetical protein [Methylomirabilota bacterium]